MIQVSPWTVLLKRSNLLQLVLLETHINSKVLTITISLININQLTTIIIINLPIFNLNSCHKASWHHNNSNNWLLNNSNICWLRKHSSCPSLCHQINSIIPKNNSEIIRTSITHNRHTIQTNQLNSILDQLETTFINLPPMEQLTIITPAEANEHSKTTADQTKLHRLDSIMVLARDRTESSIKMTMISLISSE